MFVRKCRWIFVALLSSLVVLPGTAWALGLGEIEVESALNERFVGSIELLDAQGLQSSEVVVSMAGREDFDRVGVERFFYLTNLKFDVSFTSNGAAVVNVSSSQPVSEPYLNFIVEVLWPNGRLLKEYTVLLDPPTFSQAAAPAVSAPAQSVASAPPQPAASAPTRVRVPPRTAPSTPAATQRSYDGSQLLTTRDDTLWKIAQRTTPSDRVSVNQQMLAIQRLNPNAFIRNNINLLKAGYTLELPNEAQALGLDSSDADVAVADQTEAWRSGAETPALASAPTPLVDDSPAQQRSQVDLSDSANSDRSARSEPQGEVRIVANSGELASGTSAGDDASLNQLIEEKATLSRQVEELGYQLDREQEISANTIDVKDRQLEVKNKEVAELQEQLRQMREQIAQAAKNQNQSASQPTTDVPWWQTPIVLGAVIGVLVLLLVGLLIAGRRDRSDDYGREEPEAYIDERAYEDDYAESGEDAADDFDDALSVEQADGDVEPTIGGIAAATTEVLDSGFDSEGDDAEANAGTTQTSDVVGEAEIYIAYGRYGQAANLLLGALQEDPDRHDVRLKLLETYVESSEQEAFAEHAEYLLANCDDDDVLHACRELESQMEDGQALNLDDLDGDEPETTSEADSTESNEATAEDDFLIDDDELVSLEDQPDTEAQALDNTADTTVGEEEFELEFDDEPAAASDEEEFTLELDDEDTGSDASSELGGDLGLDFNPDADDASSLGDEATEADTSADDLDDLDELIMDLDDDSGAAEADADPIEFDGTSASSESNATESSDDDFAFADEGDADINTTKLDLAEAYVDMGDADGARDILNEVAEEGTPEQQDKARELLAKL